MGEELILLILLAIVVFVCGVALLFACCKKSHGHNHDDPHETRQDLDRTLKSPENSLSLVVDLDAHDFLEGVECVICLSELVDGDIAQVLPNCYHWFHAECIYAWLESESTCPICRVMVGSQPASSVASISSGELVIQIPVVEP